MKTFDLLTKEFSFLNLDEYEQNGWSYISYTRVTQSYADGPEPDYSNEISEFLEEHGYEQVDYVNTGHDERNYENIEIYIYAKI